MFRDPGTIYNVAFTSTRPVNVKTDIPKQGPIEKMGIGHLWEKGITVKSVSRIKKIRERFITLKEHCQLMQRALVMYQKHHKIDLSTYIGKYLQFH